VVDHNSQFDNPEFNDTEFEHDLRQALQPRSAPPGFAARLMQLIPPDAEANPAPEAQPASAPSPRRARIFAFPAPLRLAAVASLLIVILSGTFAWQQRQRRIEGERASRQVMMALQITHATLQQVAQNVSSIQNRKEIHP
jgi:hypothetical protein